MLPAMKVNEKLPTIILLTELFKTASVIQRQALWLKIEELGIGRPSTYAPTLLQL
jgi:DNA topoisomerase IA